MKLTIDNLDGHGAVDYSSVVVTNAKFSIARKLNEPSLCSFTVAPATSVLPTPARNGRVIVSDDSGIVLFTGYIPTEPALQLLGQNSQGAAYQAYVAAVSDEVLLSRLPTPQSQAAYSQPASQLLQTLNAGVTSTAISFATSASSGTIGEFQPDPAQTWSENAGALASIARSAYRALNNQVTITPVGSVVHTLSEATGTLSLAQLEASQVKALANDVTVCGPSEPAAYVTEFFEGDGITVLFNFTQQPYFPPASKSKPLIDLFQEPTINPQLWQVSDPGSHLSITAAGLTCTGGDGIMGDTLVSTVNQLELGGSLVLEAGGVQFGSITSGILNGLYSGAFIAADCLAGFEITTASGVASIAPLVNGVIAGSSFTPTAGHMYTLRLRIAANEIQRVLQTYNSVDNTGAHTYGGTYLQLAMNLLFEVQDTTGGVAAAPVILYSGSIAATPGVCTLAVLNSSSLQCSIASIEVSQQGPVWVESTPPGATTIVHRMGTTAQGADCRIERTGRVHFYTTSIPQIGEVIAVSYRTTHRAVARLANAASIAQESVSGAIPGTAAWIGAVTSPAARSSVDCENAATAILDLATNRAAAWKGTYTGWNLETQSDVWPGDVLAIDSASANLNAVLVVRSVAIELLCTAPGVVKYVIAFANDWADALAIKTSSAIPADVWLPQQAETTLPLANLSSLAITGVSTSAIAVSANATPPTGGGFEVRRRDWAFGPGTNSDLVLRSPVANFSIPREAVTEQYYIRTYDASTPPNYSRFSSAVFVNMPL
ncbi:hypothetical protein HNQ77_003683 [Silvibacterium bohemicum]|uniref:Uncharacterized protein n=1 Tax=Silvibacterium bohemicum TaxID=1577686 RepID=A0A841JWG7_9BACT|nr:hypothetical protein [Silvibacterium bohemicum]MBB6145722.1 hypothetical protein [Silvibacterium bohemicum]